MRHLLKTIALTLTLTGCIIAESFIPSPLDETDRFRLKTREVQNKIDTAKRSNHPNVAAAERLFAQALDAERADIVIRNGKQELPAKGPMELLLDAERAIK